MKNFTMMKILAKNVVRGPATLMHPRRRRKFTPVTRGHVQNAIEVCILCGLCARRCPTYALAVDKPAKQWQIDRLKCCLCGLCVEICPVKSLSMENRYAPPVTHRPMAVVTEVKEPAGREEPK
jgi:ech hydrogenase subunit F